MAWFYLEVIRGEQSGSRYAVAAGATSIGRGPVNAIAFPESEKEVSAHQLIVFRSTGRILVQDQNSTNGTYVNGTKIDEKEVAANDEISFGINGPCLRLVVSETELPVAAQQERTIASTMNRTQDLRSHLRGRG
ncbi:MAG: FHA domain-containing protein [Chitinispirillaceae bacterium]|jgi:pSer/pThr/pTyr-binding forkhead associated (FHA) protein|nr:FHA domain-containing protein [Chitinispirillaceae bacterium]